MQAGDAGASSDRATNPRPRRTNGEPPGMREQFSATIDAARRMAEAHLELARAEFSEIADEVARVAILVGLAIGVLILLAILLPIGLVLFLGEWLFGSIGWGVLLFTDTALLIVVVAAAAAIGTRRSAMAGALGGAVIVGAVLAVAFAFGLTNEAWTRLGLSVAPGVEAGARPLATGTVALAAVGALLGLIWGARRGGAGGAVGGLIFGAISGAVAGALSAIRFGSGPGAALGIVVGLGAASVLIGRVLLQNGIDRDALKARFWPSQTIATTKETIEWVREQTPLGPRP